MGLFDDNNYDFFGGMFDFDGDGKTTWNERFLGFMSFEDFTKEDTFDDDYDSDDFGDMFEDDEDE